MEITYEEAEAMIQKRLQMYPEIKALVSDPHFQESLRGILEFEEISQELLPLIESKVMIVLTFYAPISELAQNIAQSTGLPLEKCESLVALIDSILFESIRDEIYAFEYHTNMELAKIDSVPDANPDSRERLELHPDGESGKQFKIESHTRPLTRDELMNALAPKRTMAGDIEAVRQQSAE